jgi:hypothetical protein
MDICEGFKIDQPNILVPWRTSPEELRARFHGLSLQEINESYLVTRCVSLGGLSHKLGFHFYLPPRVGLWYFELFDNGYPDNPSSFRAFQEHLEATFGQPTTALPGEEGFPSYTWRFKGCVVFHQVQERFGPAEIVRIERSESP